MTRDGDRPWRPLLEGDAAEQARQVVLEIAAALVSPAVPPRPDASLAAGDAGQALLFAALARAVPGQGHDDRALALLERAFEAVSGESGPSLYAGFTGVGWAAEHLRGRLLDEGDENGADVDEALESVLATPPPPGLHDLVSGLVGLGIYALERMPSPTAHRLLERVIAGLGALSVRGGDGCCWPTADGKLADVGVAHGIGGVVALLSAAWSAGIETARPLLDGAVTWLLAHRLPSGGETRCPAFVPLSPDSPPAEPTRSAWCYGDPGVALALLSAARATRQSSWEQEALALARAAARRSPERTGVIDAGLCHGAAGLGHLFHRLYQATQEAPFAEAARSWFARSLALRRPGEGIAGFRAFEPHGQQWHDDPGLLTGAAGVALALLSAAWPVPPSWDRMLLADLPRVPA